jgi:hypothetical protein
MDYAQFFMVQEDIYRGDPCICGAEWKDGALDHNAKCDYLQYIEDHADEVETP